MPEVHKQALIMPQAKLVGGMRSKLLNTLLSDFVIVDWKRDVVLVREVPGPDMNA